MANLETLQKLLELRCDPNPPLQGLGITPLLSAVALSRGNPKCVEIVRSLLKARANPNVASRRPGESCEHGAFHGHGCYPHGWMAWDGMTGATPIYGNPPRVSVTYDLSKMRRHMRHIGGNSQEFCVYVVFHHPIYV